jgi:polyferredoxin
MSSYKGIINASFFVFIFIFLTSLFLGRAYCSWFCPGCGVQELLCFVVKKKSKNGKVTYLKYVIFTIWIVAIIIGYSINGFQKINLAAGMSDINIQKKIIMTIGAIAIIVPLTAVFGQFASCKYICWQALFVIIGTKIRDYFKLPGLRLAANSEKCISCKLCNKKCSMNIDVMRKVKENNVFDSECILCGSCIDACKSGVITFTIKK